MSAHPNPQPGGRGDRAPVTVVGVAALGPNAASPGHLHELGGDLPAAGAAYADAAARATNVAERDHLIRQAARARAAEQQLPFA